MLFRSVERANILPPQSLMGTIGDDVRMQVIQSSEFNHKYGTPIDRDSAYEILERMRQQREQEETMLAERQALEKERLQWEKEKAKLEKAAKKPAPRKQKGAIERMNHSALNTVGREVTHSLIRGLMGGLKK